MISYIELENWKTHGNTKLYFSNGSNILIGQMGAGKSSIMDAISFALFGTFPAIKDRRISINAIIRNRPNQKRRASVKLGFVVDGQNYTVKREISLDATAKAVLEKNDAYVQSQPQRVNEEIEKILKVDYDLFSRAVYSEQNRLDYFLELGASERKKQIDALLGLDKFANAQENTTSLINRIKAMVADEEKTAESFDINRLKEQLDAINKEMEGLEKEEEALKTAIDRLRIEKTRAEKELRWMKDSFNKRIALAKEIAEIKSKVETLKSEIGKIDGKEARRLTDIESSLKELDKSIKKLGEEEKLAIEEMQSSQAKMGKLENELSRIDKDISERNKLSEGLNGKDSGSATALVEQQAKELERLEKDIAYHSSKIEENRKWLEELEKHLGRCPVCERELGEEMRISLLDGKKKAVKESEAKAKEAGDLRKGKREQIAKLNEQLNMLHVIEERLKAYSSLDERRKNAFEANEAARLESQKARGKREELNHKLAKDKEGVDKLRAAKDALERKEGYLKEKEHLEMLMEKKNEELAGIVVDEDMLERMQNSFVELNSELGKSVASADANKKAIIEKKDRIKSKREEIENINKIYNGVKAKKDVAENLAKFKNALQETQIVLRNKLMGSINDIMQQIWPELYPYGDYGAVSLAVDENDYVLKANSNANNGTIWQNVEGIASGGERSIACLAMRIAFALVLVPNLRWLILDEPTHNIDQQGLAKFVRLFNEVLPNIVDQTFIITHDELLKQVSSGKIFMLNRNKEENKETVVEEL